jgi:hypothetical protein
VAKRLERALFERGFSTTLIDVETTVDVSRSPALLSDVAEQCVRAGLLTVLSTSPPRAADREQLRLRLGGSGLVWLRLGGSADAEPQACSLPENDDAAAVSAVLKALADRGLVAADDD